MVDPAEHGRRNMREHVRQRGVGCAVQPAGQQQLVGLGNPAHAQCVEDVGVVLQTAHQVVAIGQEPQAQVLGGARLQHVQRLVVQVAPLQLACRGFLEREEGLPERGTGLVTGRAHGLQDAVGRHVTVAEGGDDGLADLFEQLAAGARSVLAGTGASRHAGRRGAVRAGVGPSMGRGLIVAEVEGERQGVDEEAHHLLQLGQLAATHGGADAQRGLPRQAVQQQGPDGQQRHERGGVLLAGVLAQPGHQGLGQV